MSAPLRWTLNAAAVAALLGALLLWLAWRADRSHRWETPRWQPRAFVPLKGEPGPAGESATRWVMAINLRCGHCLSALDRTQAAWAERNWQPELGALVVDTPRRPTPPALRAIPAARVWWDSRGIWRRRWGHRVYGELLQFDRSGRCLRVVTASDLLRGSRLPESEAPAVPAKHHPSGG